MAGKRRSRISGMRIYYDLDQEYNHYIDIDLDEVDQHRLTSTALFWDETAIENILSKYYPRQNLYRTDEIKDLPAYDRGSYPAFPAECIRPEDVMELWMHADENGFCPMAFDKLGKSPVTGIGYQATKTALKSFGLSAKLASGKSSDLLCQIIEKIDAIIRAQENANEAEGNGHAEVDYNSLIMVLSDLYKNLYDVYAICDQVIEMLNIQMPSDDLVGKFSYDLFEEVMTKILASDTLKPSVRDLALVI